MFYVVNATIGLSRKEMEEEQKETVFGVTTLEHKELIGWLKSQKFDLAFAHMFDVCPIGLIHAAQIPSWIWLNSWRDEFRTKSEEFDWAWTYKVSLEKLLWVFRWIVEPEMDLFRTYLSPDFPDILELAAKCPLVIHSIPYS
ncbi:unnamed protein product [Strongylus vulgaris]|uniref:Uncharacterized protein n=1 Tax=Strongylus vulgaris TaxID=40348 RepID=A0A3P7JB59_STRVU|nr:unnamed protein product [Strongylus vulgaris]